MIELSTDHLLLRPFQRSDSEDMAAYAVQPGFYRYLPIPEQTAETVTAFVDEQIRQQQTENEDKVILAVVDKPSNRVVGTIRLDIHRYPIPIGSLGFSMDPDLQGGIYMKEAGIGMLKHAFGELGLIRVWSYTDVDNERGNRVMEELGMMRKKRIAKAMAVRGVVRDVYQYSLDAADFLLEEPAEHRVGVP